MAEKIQSVKGTHDILPSESWKWQILESSLHDVMARFGYKEIKTPAFEKTELFARGVGETTDIVSKEMYSFKDKGGTSVTLKPEITAPVIRSYLQHNLGKKSPVTKLYYIDSAFRQERPQAGRFRQFNQFGVEAIGSPHPEIDAEVIILAYESLAAAGLEDMTLKLNSIGEAGSRAGFRTALVDYLKPHMDDLSETSRKRINTNPLRILDTKSPEELNLLENAPSISDYLTPDDANHFAEVCELLQASGTPFEIDPTLVRGLDYYTRTTFEIIAPELGAQDALCGGGRYDGLVETLGGPPTPAVGFATGIERVLLSLDAGQDQNEPAATQIYFISQADEGRSTVLSLMNQCRSAGTACNFDPLRRSVKAQMREANKSGASIAVIIGETELQAGTVVLKDLESSDQTEIKQSELAAHLGTLNL